MKQYLATIIFLLISVALYAQNKSSVGMAAQLTPGASLLFKGVKSKISVAEKNELFQKLKLKVDPASTSFTMEGTPVSVQVFPTDMNKDGQEELFILFNGVQLFGDQPGLSLYMKSTTGNYQQQPDIAGGYPMILSSLNKGYPDIAIAGRGLEHPVLRWNGSKYTNWKKIKDESLSAALDIDAYSKSFTGAK